MKGYPGPNMTRYYVAVSTTRPAPNRAHLSTSGKNQEATNTDPSEDRRRQNMDDASLHRHNACLGRIAFTLLTLSIQLVGRCSAFGTGRTTLPAGAAVFHRAHRTQHRHPGTALHGLAVEDMVSAVTSSNAVWHQHSATAKVLLAQLVYLDGATSTVVAIPSAAANLRPATGHSQPLFGPPDPYLTAGKSIAPSTKVLLEMGVDVSSKSDLRGAAGSLPIMDGSMLKPAAGVLPGFAPTHGILPTSTLMTLPGGSGGGFETPDTALINTQWSLSIVDVVDKLPQAVFLYALVDFFILKPNIDLYKEDIEAEPGTITLDWATGMLVRLATFGVIAAVTNAI
jgi:hypothetical protein